MKKTLCFRLVIGAFAVACARPDGVPAQADASLSPFDESRDPAVRAAGTALAEGRPWRASEILDSAYRTAESRSPEVVLLSASAAAAWGGWSRVEHELGSAAWVDTLFEGRGRELLARAALARGADSAARIHAERAVYGARNDRDRGVREVLLARSLDRLAIGDSAAATYMRAARHLPLIADWLALRAAGATANAAARQRHYARITSDVARARVKPTEAQARQRWKDFAGAAEAYAELGDRAQSLRLRLLANPDSAERARVRGEAFGLLAGSVSPAQARVLIDLADSALGPLAATEELTVARAAQAAGLYGRAATGFARADRTGLEPRDRYAYASVLSRLGRDADAAREFARIPARSAQGSAAAYQHARSLLRAGRGAQARAALRKVVSSFARDTSIAAQSLFLLADLATDDGRDADARSTFGDIVRRYPTSGIAPEALFRSGIIAYASGNFASAARDFERLIERYPRSLETTSARYWAGRARDRAGERARATAHWRAVMTSDPLSYYAMMSARRLGVAAWRPSEAAESLATTPELERAVDRAALLDALGMSTEENLEYDHIAAVRGSPDSLLAAADALRARGEVSRAMGLARRALDAAAPRDTRLFGLLYPVAYGDLIRAEASAKRVDPALVAALIRQESNFSPRAVSRAGAVGLMQVLPSVGASIAKAEGITSFDRVLLYQPDVNIRLGMSHLAAMLRQYPRVEYALAAYNAGGSPVQRWRTKGGTDDPEVFIERIPYGETRDYVRILLRNQAMYRTLYSW